MKLSRNFSLKLHWLLDECLPPILRDSRLIMTPLMWLLFGDKTNLFLRYKQQVWSMTPDEYKSIYQVTLPYHIERETDLNSECVDRIISTVSGRTVLEVGCGRGYLSRILSRDYSVTATDIDVDSSLVNQLPEVRFMEASVENLPFCDRSFDTVVCTHTLEHVPDIQAAVGELRRVMRKRLIIVVPKQRPYRYTYDLHVHFFPYPFILCAALGNVPGSRCDIIGKDLFYVEYGC
jgi:SAM-dependent methyltransferase